jgi:hypothetical protein
VYIFNALLLSIRLPNEKVEQMMMKNRIKIFSLTVTRVISCALLLASVMISHQALSSEETELESKVKSSSQTDNSIANNIERLKKEVLTLNRELFILEEDLLFPANTQVSVFVSVDIGRFFTLDSVELKLNNEDVAGFLYTQRQRESLEQGGIQRLFKGNLKTGRHQITAIFIGLDQEQRTVKRAVTHEFEKEDDAVMIELKVEDNSRNLQAEVHVEEWNL